jgi:hypothetical protein
MSEQKEQIKDEYWLALGMIEPEWVFMSHFLEKAEDIEETIVQPEIPIEKTMIIRLRGRVDKI